MVQAQQLQGNGGQGLAGGFKTKFSARFIKEDFGTEVNSEANFNRYLEAVNTMAVSDLKVYEKYLEDNGFVSGVSARERQQAKDLWDRNTLNYCTGHDKENKNYPNSTITSARDAVGTQSPTGGDKWASDPDFRTADILRINKVACNRMSAYHKIEADRLRAEALALVEDAKAEGQNAAVFDLYSKAAGFTLVACGVAAIFTIGAIALVNAGAIVVAGGRAIVSAGGIFARMGWLGKILTMGLTTALPTLWGYAVQGFYFVYNFDWNMSDAAIDKTTTSGVSAVAGSLGEFVGAGFGWLACGFAPATAIAAADPLKGLLVKEEVTEEMIEELSQELWEFIRQAGRQVARAAFLQSFKFTRRWIQDKSSLQYKIFSTAFGKDAINNWGKGKPFTIAGQITESIESVSENPYIRAMLGEQGAEAVENFLEETVENFIDSCVEAGFVLTSAYSTAARQQERAKTATFGEMRTVEIEFMRS